MSGDMIFPPVFNDDGSLTDDFKDRVGRCELKIKEEIKKLSSWSSSLDIDFQAADNQLLFHVNELHFLIQHYKTLRSMKVCEKKWRQGR